MGKNTVFNHKHFLEKQRLYYRKKSTLNSDKLPNLDRGNFLLPEIRELILWLNKNKSYGQEE